MGWTPFGDIISGALNFKSFDETEYMRTFHFFSSIHRFPLYETLNRFFL